MNVFVFQLNFVLREIYDKNFKNVCLVIFRIILRLYLRFNVFLEQMKIIFNQITFSRLLLLPKMDENENFFLKMH